MLMFESLPCILCKLGIHWLQPFVTSVVQIRLTPETKIMSPLICTTRDGVRNVFRDVQVNYLKLD